MCRYRPGTAVSSQFEGGRVDFGFLMPNDTPAEWISPLLAIQSSASVVQLGSMSNGGLPRRRRSRTTLHSCWRSGNGQVVLAEGGSGGSLAASRSASAAGSRAPAGALVGTSMHQLRQLLSVVDAAWQDASSAEQRVCLLTEQVASRSQCPWAIGGGKWKSGQGSTSVLFAAWRAPVATSISSVSPRPSMIRPVGG